MQLQEDLHKAYQTVINNDVTEINMKLKLNKEELNNAISIVQRAVASKTSMNILECILITANEDRIVFTSSNMDLGIETFIRCERSKISEPGMTAIDAKLFSDIIRKITEDPNDDIVLNSDGNIVELKSSTSTFKIQERDAEQFPEFPVVNEDNYISLSQFTLREVIRDTIFSVAMNDSNKLMTGELFEVSGDNLKVASLDGHRISIRNAALKDNYGNFKAVIPGKTLSEISKILNGEMDDEVNIFFENETVMFRFDNTTVVSRLIEGEYFNINSMLSNDFETRLTMNRKELLSHVEKATILVRENDKKPLVFDIKDQQLTLKINSVLGSLNSEMMVNKTGKDLMIGFNPKFLQDILGVIDEDEISMYLTNSKAPGFIRDDDNTYNYLILPINFNQAAY